MEYVEVARAQSARGEVLLRERLVGDDQAVLELRVNGVFVMDTGETGSERALARQALELVDRPSRVLVGGLGLGFTTREVLADRRVEQVSVVEIEEALIDWMRAGRVAGGPELLADPRLTLLPGDIRDVLAELSPAYDLVLLDVDNGPGYLVHDTNEAVYRAPFLERVRDVLAPGGAVVVWAANEAPELESTMRTVFGDCTPIVHPVRLQEREVDYLLYLSRAPQPAG